MLYKEKYDFIFINLENNLDLRISEIPAFDLVEVAEGY